MNDHFRLVRGFEGGAEDLARERLNELNHPGDHPGPAHPGVVRQGQRQSVGVAGEGRKVEPVGLRQSPERGGRGQADRMTGAAEPDAQGDEGFDVSARAIRQERDTPGLGG